MTLAVHVATDRARAPIATSRLAALARGVLAAEGVREAMLSVALVSPAAIAKINREHLGRRGATDVIAFGFSAAGVAPPVVGDVYICPDVARENAALHRTGVREEVARCVIHGTLHVLGYDHPAGEGRTGSDMWRRQEQLLRRLFTAAPARRHLGRVTP